MSYVGRKWYLWGFEHGAWRGGQRGLLLLLGFLLWEGNVRCGHGAVSSEVMVVKSLLNSFWFVEETGHVPQFLYTALVGPVVVGRTSSIRKGLSCVGHRLSRTGVSSTRAEGYPRLDLEYRASKLVRVKQRRLIAKIKLRNTTTKP